MKHFYRSLSLFIAIIMLISMALAPTGVAYSQNNHVTVIDMGQASCTESDKQELEELATNYVEAFIEKSYLYKPLDLSEGTIKQYAAANLQNIDLTNCGVSFDDKLITIQSLCDNISLFEDVAEFYCYTRSAQDIQRRNFTLSTYIQKTVVSGNLADVYLYAEVSYQYNDNVEYTLAGDNYTIQFACFDNQWYIINASYDEMKYCGISQESFDLKKQIEIFDSIQSENSRHNATTSDGSNVGYFTPAAVSPLTVSVAYSRNNAIAYAYTYTTSSHNGLSGNNSSFLNPNFPDYSNGGGNCQNFASQCVWAGFNGSDTAAATDVSSIVSFPMIGSGSFVWKNGNYPWINTVGFFNQFYNAQQNNASGQRIRGSYYYPEAIISNFSGISSATTLLPGSIVYCIGSAGAYNHAIVITKATSASFSDIEFCANSPMRKAYPLSEATWYTTHLMRVAMPSSIVASDNCSHQYASSSTGTSRHCLICNRNYLFPRGTMTKPIAVGTTKSIGGTVNVQCYRVAIGITTPSGTTTWQEFTNCTHAYRTYTFNQTGLYTVQFAARDIAPSELNSINVTHTFKIRVY